MKKTLTIAGSDPSGGAGIQADLKVFRSFGVYGLSAISALTAQNSGGVRGILPVSGDFLKKQLFVLLSDIRPDAAKTGMLYSEENVRAVAGAMKRFHLENIVVDPVILSSTGRRLAEGGVPEAIKRRLLPLCTVVTPNIHEASVLTGIAVKTMSDMEKAALRLKAFGCANVIITGGHLEKIAMDLVYDGDFHRLKSTRVCGEYHGTGCTFSAALTALLARGHSVLEAARLSKRFMNRAFRKTFGASGGMRLFDI
jgi:hydroxymethylpyrimidine/phosphomethylpyrimidine kinase